MTRDDQWDRIFDELYLRTYAVLERGAEPEPEALAAARLAGVERGADVLDCPCGYGRHSIPLARAGFHVVGADRSPVLLEEARRRAGEDGPTWVQADHRDLPFPDASFDAVLNLFSSLGYRGEEGDRQTLSEFRRVLRPGGALVVETLHRDRLASIFEPRQWEPLPDGGFVLEERVFDQAAGEIATTLHLVDAAGRHESASYRMRCYTATDVVRLVAGAGFTAIECFGGLDREPLTIETRLVVLARAPD
jgi:ubiquinone/menaquinone biosynthesis C-methylase UbiE